MSASPKWGWSFVEVDVHSVKWHLGHDYTQSDIAFTSAKDPLCDHVTNPKRPEELHRSILASARCQMVKTMCIRACDSDLVEWDLRFGQRHLRDELHKGLNEIEEPYCTKRHRESASLLQHAMARKLGLRGSPGGKGADVRPLILGSWREELAKGGRRKEGRRRY